MTKSWGLCAGGFVASLVASCSFTVGDLTLTPPKGEVGGNSGQVGGQYSTSQAGNANSHGGTAQGGTTRTGTASAVGSNTLSNTSGATASLGGNNLGGNSSGSGASDPSLAGRGNSVGGGAITGGTVNANSSSTVTTGGASRGGTSNGGANTGGSNPSLAGKSASLGGNATLGGSANAGASATATTGGASRGGTSSGGANTGGAPTGGVATGGVATGGSVASGCTGNLETINSISGLCMAKSVSIVPPTGMAPYSINATEVTRGQYEQWLTKNPAPYSSNDTVCGWDTSYAPDPTCMNKACATNCDHHPQVCVDWCDASAYCISINKRLCGRIGGMPSPWTESTNAETNQWHRACTSGGQYVYPYGNSFESGRCNDYEYWAPDYAATTVPVASFPSCQSSVVGYSGAYDLSGNVSEWEDACESDASNSMCYVRGGMFVFAGADVDCASDFAYQHRDATVSYLGFRCCSN